MLSHHFPGQPCLQPGSWCPGIGRTLGSLCVGPSPGQLEVAGPLQRSLRRLLNPPSYPWSGTCSTPFHRREAQRPAQLPKATQPGSYPAAADFKTFLPAHREANDFQVRCAHG